MHSLFIFKNLSSDFEECTGVIKTNEFKSIVSSLLFALTEGSNIRCDSCCCNRPVSVLFSVLGSHHLLKWTQQHLHFCAWWGEHTLPLPSSPLSTEARLRACWAAVSPSGLAASGPRRRNRCRVVRTAEKITGTSLPSFHDVFHRRCHSRASIIITDSTHPHLALFSCCQVQDCQVLQQFSFPSN